MMYSILAVICGFILDMLFGDPVKMPHIVRLMGRTIAFLEKIFLTDRRNRIREKIMGFIMVLIMLILYGAVPYVIITYLYSKAFAAGFVIEVFVCYQMLAAKSLKSESMKVYERLNEENLDGARYAVSMIVGRDTEKLSEEGVIKAAVETIAENTSDGVIAPLFYMLIAGAPFAMAYKAVNTMDSMVGYKNERYFNFGYFPAKTDDLFNFIPARISAVLMIAASFVLGYDTKNAIRIFIRDRYKHKSPNSAQTESVCAGALRIELAGDASYFGKTVKKPYIGDALQNIEKEDIVRADRLMYATAYLAVILGIIIKVILIIL